MAYICTKDIPCSKCEHYQPDHEWPNRKSCFAQQDEANKNKENIEAEKRDN